MPRNAEVIRQWHILREIEASRRATIDGLAEKTGVTTRTIRRDLEALQTAGFPLYDETIDGRKYWTMDVRPFRGLSDTGFTLSELCALYFSRALLECLAGAPFHDDLQRAFGKLEGALAPGMRQFLDRLPAIIQAKADPIRTPDRATRALIAQLLDATLRRRRATMSYHSFSSNRTKDYLVEPRRLVYAQGGLYLIAGVPEYGGLRTFAVERIRRFSPLEETFEAPDDEGEVFAHSLGVTEGEPEHVEIAFAPEAARYVRERQWHASQTLTSLPDGGVLLTLDVCVDWALRSWILGFGPAARVRRPSVLAERIRRDHEEAAGKYAG
jgi:predicted DNA-binding transcriptional regulator YafY